MKSNEQDMSETTNNYEAATVATVDASMALVTYQTKVESYIQDQLIKDAINCKLSKMQQDLRIIAKSLENLSRA